MLSEQNNQLLQHQHMQELKPFQELCIVFHGAFQLPDLHEFFR